MENLLEFLTLNDINNYKCSLSDIQRISPMLDESNYMTYYIFLQCRPDIVGEEREYYVNKMNELKEEENELIKSFLENNICNNSIEDK